MSDPVVTLITNAGSPLSSVNPVEITPKNLILL